MRGEWIEINLLLRLPSIRKASLPMRGEWIEMRWALTHAAHGPVSPHAGRVD